MGNSASTWLIQSLADDVTHGALNVCVSCLRPVVHRAHQDDDIYKRLKSKKEHMEKKTARCKLLSQCITCKTLSQAKGKLKGDYEEALKKAKGSRASSTSSMRMARLSST